MGRQIRHQSVGIQDLTVVLDDRIGDERGNDPGDQNEEDDAEAFKLSLGFFREKPLHPYRCYLHEHDIAAAKEEQTDQQRPVQDRRRIDVFRSSEKSQDTYTDDA